MTKLTSLTKRQLYHLPKKLRRYYTTHQEKLCCQVNPIALVMGRRICRDCSTFYKKETYDDIYKITGLNLLQLAMGETTLASISSPQKD